MAVFSITSNVCVLFLRSIFDKGNKSEAFLLRVLCVSDASIGIHMFLLSAVNAYYRNEYAFYSNRWVNSITCRAMSIVTSISFIASTLLTDTITVLRYLVLVKGNYEYMKRSSKLFVCLATCVVLFAIFPVIGVACIHYIWYEPDKPILSNSLCLLFVLYRPVLRSSAIFSMYINTFMFGSFILISYCYMAIIRETRKTENEILKFGGLHKTKTLKKFNIVCFVNVASSNVFCWFPLQMLSITFLVIQDIPVSTVHMVVLFILPLGVAFNPYLYTLTNKEFKEKVAEKRKQLAAKGLKDADPNLKSLEKQFDKHRNCFHAF